jgi:hypothetical protein
MLLLTLAVAIGCGEKPAEPTPAGGPRPLPGGKKPAGSDFKEVPSTKDMKK